LFDRERPGGGGEEYCVGVGRATVCKYIPAFINKELTMITFRVN
jgi:hypothetical protein